MYWKRLVLLHVPARMYNWEENTKIETISSDRNYSSVDGGQG